MAGQAIPLNQMLLLRIRGPLTPERLRSALGEVRDKNPFSAVKVSLNEEGRPFLTTESVPEFPLRVLQGAGDLDWVRVAGEELLHPFSWDTGPLVRFVLMEGPEYKDLFVVSHHGVYDGRALLFLVKATMAALVGESLPLRASLPPNMDVLLRERVFEDRRARTHLRLLSLLFPLLRTFFRILGRRRAQANTGPPSRTEESPITILSRVLDQADTERIISRCRVEKIGVHALLCAAWVQAFVENTPKRRRARCLFSCPVDLRSRFKSPLSEGLGLYLGTLHVKAHTAPGRELREEAKRIASQLAKGFGSSSLFLRPLLVSSFLSSVPPELLRSLMAVFFEGPAGKDLTISNLGALGLPSTQGDLEIATLYAMGNVRKAVKTAVMATQGGKLTMTLAFRTEKTDPLYGERIMNGVVARLLAFSA